MELEYRQDNRHNWRKRAIAALIIGVMPSSVYSTAQTIVSMELGVPSTVPIAQTGIPSGTPMVIPRIRPTPITASKTLAEITINMPSAGLLSVVPEPELPPSANRFNPSARQLVGIDIATGESLTTPSTDTSPVVDLPVPRIQPVESTVAPPAAPVVLAETIKIIPLEEAAPEPVQIVQTPERQAPQPVEPQPVAPDPEPSAPEPVQIAQRPEPEEPAPIVPEVPEAEPDLPQIVLRPAPEATEATDFILSESGIAALPQLAPSFDAEASDLPDFDASMPIINSQIARLQLDEWFNRLAKAPLRHPSVLAAEFGEQEAISTISEAKAILYPQVAVSLSADSQKSIRDGQETSSVQGLEASDEVRLNPNVTISQLVYDGGASQSRIKAAQARSEAATSRKLSTELGIALRAADTLIELAKLQEQLDAARDNLDEVSRLRDMIRARVEMGRDSPSEMLQMNTRVFEARNQVVRLLGLRAEAGARHEETFGEPPVILAFPDVFAPIPMSVDSGMDVAMRFNPDIINARHLIDAASAEWSAAQRDGLPRIEVEARMNAYDAIGSGTDYYDTFVGLSVSHNLFDGGRQKAIKERSANALERTQAQYEQTLADIELALKRAYANRESIIPSYKSLQAQLDQKLKTRIAYEEQFITGRRPLNDLITAQQQVLDAALTVIDSKAELHRQHFTILALIGDLAVKPKGN